MKKVLLLVFLFIGMVSFGNTVPTHSVVAKQGSTIINMVTPNTNGAYTESYHFRTNEVVAKTSSPRIFANPNVDVQPTSCTVETNITIGYNGSGVTIKCAATAPTCKEALQMILDCMPQ